MFYGHPSQPLIHISSLFLGLVLNLYYKRETAAACWGPVQPQYTRSSLLSQLERLPPLKKTFQPAWSEEMFIYLFLNSLKTLEAYFELTAEDHYNSCSGKLQQCMPIAAGNTNLSCSQGAMNVQNASRTGFMLLSQNSHCSFETKAVCLGWQKTNLQEIQMQNSRGESDCTQTNKST